MDLQREEADRGEVAVGYLSELFGKGAAAKKKRFDTFRGVKSLLEVVFLPCKQVSAFEVAWFARNGWDVNFDKEHDIVVVSRKINNKEAANDDFNRRIG